MEMMPEKKWLSSRAVSRLIGTADERKTRARLDRLVGDGEIQRKSEQGDHGLVYIYRRPGASTNSIRPDPVQLRTLISDLRRGIRYLETGIETEGDGVSACDIGNRRDNLLATISALETYLNDLDR
jgi:hypothetical protein